MYFLKQLTVFVTIGLIATASSAQTYQISKSRVLQLLDKAYHNINELRNDNYKLVITNSPEMNAWSLGPLIIVTKNLLMKADDQVLMAVLLHEIAHSKEHHMASRMSTFAGINVWFSIERLKNLFTGKNNSMTYMQQLAEFSEQYSTIQEIQADCVAYNWLKELETQHLNFNPQDLNRAANLIINVNFKDMPYSLGKDLPPYLRYHKVLNGHPKVCN